jgi:hypothetical protein
MENKQTVVDWLEEEINKIYFGANFITFKEFDNERIKLWQQAKIMEKEQIKEAFWNGDNSVCTNKQNSFEFAEQYYNETYNQRENDN